MTITKYDGFAFIPKRCKRCNRLFWLESYSIYYKEVGIGHYSLKQIECKECMKNENQIAKDILHKVIDNTKIAEDVYPNLRKELHEAVESADIRGK